MNCNGVQISGAQGLEGKMKWNVEGKEKTGTLLEFFAEGGAVLDEAQKQRLAELKKQRAAEKS